MRASRLDYIDSLRGLAAIAVIYLHTAGHYQKLGETFGPLESGALWLFTDIIDIGKVGVTLFFAISGFVIPASLSASSNTTLKDFAISRFFRLYPNYWVSIVVYVALAYALYGAGYGVYQIAVNATMLQQFMGVKNIVELYWTLQIELIFYVACVAMYMAGWLHRPRAVAGASAAMLALALAVAFVRWRVGVKLPVAAPLALSVMFWGFLWRSAVLDRNEEARGWIVRSTALLLAAVVPICVLAYSRDYGYGENWRRYVATYYVAVGVFMLCSTKVRLRGAWLSYLGAISYSIYLFGPFGQEMAQLLRPRLPAAAPMHVTIAFAVLFAVLTSALAWRWIEKPAIELGRRLRARPRREFLAAPAPKRA